MTTIKEDYVSFETAKLLKEKGFDEQTVKCYNLKKELYACQCIGDETINSTPNYLIAAPTLQMVMKWLRENYNFFIEIHYGNVGTPEEPKVQWWWELINKQGEFLECNITDGNTTYEAACEAAIKYCLEDLI